METKHKIAVLIDYDNFNNEEYLKLLFDELNDYGDVIIKEAYFSDIYTTIPPSKRHTRNSSRKCSP